MKAHELIRDYKDSIIDNWMKEVKTELPGSKEHDNVALTNDIPTLIDNLADALENKNIEFTHESIEHGRLRALFKNYSLLHVIREYRILKRTIFRILDLQSQVSVKDRNLIMESIDLVIEQAGEIFFQIRNQIESDARTVAEDNYQRLQGDDNLRNEFIEGLSHDMKNPITNIKLAVDILKSKVYDEELIPVLNLLEKNTDKTEVLINSLKNINFVSTSEGFPIQISPTNLTSHLSDFIQSNTIQSKYTLLSDLPEVQISGFWDVDAILRAIGNLLQNAIRYGNTQMPITIGANEVNNTVLIFVHNHGEAIPFEEQAKIFSRLYQVNNSTGVGQGLGLFTVKNIVEAHGGKVELTSYEGHGTTFRMVLPKDSRHIG
ncbi:sensor histidine kinase [Fulvivirga ligni]|uniref:sensor histidine kinase n=1 Tax=Fulvivirga ligni TaxID=2904246 RepID=UPI001F48AC1B|nr:sensor histidine kinase [Fulvivirga ligni]UII23603.1 sensor histidine kinase [Fulvivirga ligni]